MGGRDMNNHIPTLNPAIIARQMGSEIVLLEPASGRCYGINAVGLSFWQMVDGEKSLAAIIASLADEYDVALAEVTDDITALASSLAEQSLITLREPA